MRSRTWVVAIALVQTLGTAWSVAAQNSVERLVQGTVDKIDATARTMVVKTKDGATHAIAWTEKTARHGADEVRQGAHVVVHAADQAGKTVAHQTKVVAARTADWTEGTVTKVDRAARQVTVRAANGATEVYEVAKDGVMHIGRDVKAAGKDIGESIKDGTRVVVHHTTDAGRKIAHAFEEK